MTVARRWLSGSLANGARIGVIATTQIASVPIFLSCWSPAQFGVWLIVGSLSPWLTAIDLGHQNFLGYAFLKAETDDRLGRLFSSSLVAGGVIGLAGVVLTLGLVGSGAVAALFGSVDPALSQQAGTVLILQAVVWLATGSWGGLLVRAVVRYGHYPRTAWWGVVSAAVTGAAPLVGVALGGDLLAAGLWLAGGTLVVNVPMLADFLTLWRRDGSGLGTPDLRLAVRNVVSSLGVTLRDVLGQVRQQGVRLVLSPAVGVAQMTAFATTRTAANVAVQGLGSITGPFEPELLGFLRHRDRTRLDTAMAVNWAVAVALIAPGLMAAQIAAPLVFGAWTRGQIVFDPFLFALLSASVAVFAYAQTATTIVRGNNLVGAQLTISAVAAIVTLATMALLVGPLGLRGAGIALLLAEVVGCVLVQRVAVGWMRHASLDWPHRLARLSALGVAGCVAALLAAGWAPQLALPILVASFLMQGLVCVLLYRALPAMARDRIARPILQRVGSLRSGA